MFCQKCGAEITNDAPFCSQCNTDLQPPQTINSGLPLAIFTTLCCCLPFGVVSIVYASKASSLAATGNSGGAIEMARLARKWAWIGIVFGVISCAVSILLQIVFRCAASV